MNCKNHITTQALYHCETCKNYFCEECLLVRKFTDTFTAYICKECGGKCDTLVEGRRPKQEKSSMKVVETKIVQKENGKVDKVVTQVVPKTRIWSKSRFFISRIPGVLIFPFKGKGIFFIAISGALMLLFSQLSQYSETASLLLWVIYATYFSIYLFKTMEDSANGSFRLQSLPNLEYWIGMVKPLIYMALVLILCLGPAQIYFLFIRKDMDPMYGILAAVGAFFLPIFLARIALSRKISALNPWMALMGILKTLFSYLWVCIFLQGFAVLFFYLASDILPQYEKIGTYAIYFLAVYVLLISTRLLGIFAGYLYEKTAPAS